MLHISVQVLQKRVGLLEAALREKERELELQQQVAPGSSREAQLLRHQIVHNEEDLAKTKLRNEQLEQVQLSCMYDIRHTGSYMWG